MTYRPQLATLVKTPPAGDEWLHEIKFDGYRIGCHVRGSRVTLISRNGKDWTSAFPEVVDAARKLDVRDALLDGEVAMVLPDGRTSFQALQNAFAGTASRASLVYFVFDLLQLEGERLDALSVEERKHRLQKLIGRRKNGRIRYADHVTGRGAAFFDHACRAGLEGIISKRRDLPHRPGRSAGWLKTKCSLRQEFVIGGFTDPEGMRAGLGALLVGYYERGRLVFSGKVGTGFTQKLALDLRQRLDRIETKTIPFDPPPTGPLARRAHWVTPQLVCEIVFTEWTSDGKIRHPSFQGLRHDKAAGDVVRELPAAAGAVPAIAPPADGEEPTPRPRSVLRRPRRKVEAAKSAAETRPAGTPRASRGQTKSRTPAAGTRPLVAGVGISHPERVLYPDIQITKLDLARYYESIASSIVPHVRGRPLTLVRCPEGLRGECFFMKHSNVWAPEALRRVRIQEKTKIGEYLVADDLAGVVALVQMGVLEIHTWNSMDADVERPNRIVIDLDPGTSVPWRGVVAAARVVRQALAATDLESYVKTTGGRGLHVVVPLRPHADWAECLAFSRALSEAIERAAPETYTTQFAKAGRTSKILLDYLRNNRTNTSIAAYSTRARAGGSVSVPITWDELQVSLAPDAFTIRTVPARLQKLDRDPWKDYSASRQRLTRSRLLAAQQLTF